MKKFAKGLLMVLAFTFITAAFVMIGKPVEGEAAGKLAAPKITGKSSSVKTVTLKWDSVSGADGYRIYVYNKTKKKYKICGTVSASTNIFEKSGLKSGKTYSFKVAAYVEKDGKKVTQTKSKVVKVKTLKARNFSPSDFVVYDSENNKHSLSDYAGQPILINMWATWCGPCVNELPHFDECYKEYGDQIKFFMINVESSDEFSYVKEFLDYYGYSFPVYYDWNDDAYSAYGNGYIPMTIAIRADGEIVYCDAGGLSKDGLLNIIKKLLK